MFKALPLFILLFVIFNCNAQVKPTEGEILNSRLVCFSSPKEPKAKKYQFEVCEYVTLANGTPEYKKSILKISDSNKALIMLPALNKQYAWRVSFINDANKAYTTSRYYHFKTGSTYATDTTAYRMRIIKNELKDTSLYIIVDNIATIYSTDGKPTWYMPDTVMNKKRTGQMHGMRPTADGHMVAIYNQKGIEFRNDGRVVWESPDVDRVSGQFLTKYHHDIIKLDNSSYYSATHNYPITSLPFQYTFKKKALIPGKLEKRGDIYFGSIRTDNVIKFNNNKQPLWHWKTLENIDRDAFFETAIFTKDTVIVNKSLNAFYIDEKGNSMYLGYNSNDEIIKIDLTTGRLIQRFIKGSDTSKKLFYNQQGIAKGANGWLYTLNKKIADTSIKKTEYQKIVPVLTAYEEYNDGKALKEVWSTELSTILLEDSELYENGSVTTLPDGNILASTSGHLFIVSPDKKVLWEAIIEHKNKKNTWSPFLFQRSNTIYTNQLEQFILR